jgi:hypothetical protein
VHLVGEQHPSDDAAANRSPAYSCSIMKATLPSFNVVFAFVLASSALLATAASLPTPVRYFPYPANGQLCFCSFLRLQLAYTHSLPRLP